MALTSPPAIPSNSALSPRTTQSAARSSCETETSPVIEADAPDLDTGTADEFESHNADGIAQQLHPTPAGKLVEEDGCRIGHRQALPPVP